MLREERCTYVRGAVQLPGIEYRIVPLISLFVPDTLVQPTLECKYPPQAQALGFVLQQLYLAKVGVLPHNHPQKDEATLERAELP